METYEDGSCALASWNGFSRYVSNVTRDVDFSGQVDVSLPDGGQHRWVVDQPVDVVVDHDLFQPFMVQDVREDERTWGGHVRANVWKRDPPGYLKTNGSFGSCPAGGYSTNRFCRRDGEVS